MWTVQCKTYLFDQGVSESSCSDSSCHIMLHPCFCCRFLKEIDNQVQICLETESSVLTASIHHPNIFHHRYEGLNLVIGNVCKTYDIVSKFAFHRYLVCSYMPLRKEIHEYSTHL